MDRIATLARYGKSMKADAYDVKRTIEDLIDDINDMIWNYEEISFDLTDDEKENFESEWGLNMVELESLKTDLENYLEKL